MEIVVELSGQESIDRQLEALWSGGFGEKLLNQIQPRIDRLARDHYLEIANSDTAGKLDTRLGIETGAMFQDLTESIIRSQQIILDTSLDYAMDQQKKLKGISPELSFLPSEQQVYIEVLAMLKELF